MGYYIRDCASMNYKNRFRPHEILQSYVADEEVPVWQDEEKIYD
jgi:arginyl-tRNA--protein-N-Asp/Glu arginylyltransferase